MMKIISALILLIGLVWSWVMFTSKSKIGIDVHGSIQSQLALIIEDVIHKKRPDSSHFKLLKMQTEKQDDTKIIADFSYQFEDTISQEDGSLKDKTLQKISGKAILTKQLTENENIQRWVIQSIQTGPESVEFSEGIVITAQPGNPEQNEQLKNEQLNGAESEKKTE